MNRYEMNMNMNMEIMEPVSVESSPRASYGPCPGAPRKYRVSAPAPSMSLSPSPSRASSSPHPSPSLSRSLSRSLSPRVLYPSFNAAPLSDALLVATISSSALTSSYWSEQEEAVAESVGECSVCYLELPARANHVFTVCGHLFCVKCFITWCGSSNACPMCRTAIMQRTIDDVDAMSIANNDGDGDSDGDSDGNAIDVMNTGFIDDGDDGADGDDNGDSGSDGASDVVFHSVPILTWYRYMDEGLDERMSPSDNTNPDVDDEVSGVTAVEARTIQCNRATATAVFLRKRFMETLFDSGAVWAGETTHTRIPKSSWRLMWENPSTYFQGIRADSKQLFEFVLRRHGEHAVDFETNVFGYISSPVLFSVLTGMAEDLEIQSLDNWARTNEYALIVNVFSPSEPLGSYDLTDGTFTTRQLTIRFSDIRRMYYVTSIESATQ